VLEEAAALMESLMNNHPFADGNKARPADGYEFVMTALAEGEFRLERYWSGYGCTP
jgi:prophage maintenance system killer protein